MEAQNLIFITGGARSGKSTFAENYAASLSKTSGGNLHYIATSRPTDDEMKQRIASHRLQRQQSEHGWETMECPVDLTANAHHLKENDIVLLDCLTVLLTNELFRDGFGENAWEGAVYQENVMQSILTGLDAIQNRVRMLLVVSNEVLNELMTDTLLVQTYSKLLGKLHQKLVANAAESYLVEAGIPVLMKGGPYIERDHDSRNSF